VSKVIWQRAASPTPWRRIHSSAACASRGRTMRSARCRWIQALIRTTHTAWPVCPSHDSTPHQHLHRFCHCCTVCAQQTDTQTTLHMMRHRLQSTASINCVQAMWS